MSNRVERLDTRSTILATADTRLARLETRAHELNDQVGRFGPRSVPTDLRREHVLTVAAIAFVNDGFEGASMDRIATAAGVTKPVVYGLFGSKEGLFAAVVDLASAEMAQNIAVATAETDTPLAAGIRAFLSYARDHAGLWGPVFGSRQHSAVDDAVQRLQEQQVAIVAESVRRGHLNAGVEPGDREIEAIAHLIAGAVQSVGRWWDEHHELSLDDVVAFLEAAIAPTLAALRADRAGSTWFDGGDPT
ncbi:MAG: TetR/AcrR family transcriptional regulator [Ilumatobacter fluminis]|uniref:TetR family transcriptional regulator n=1 Tax=Ilumatobacter fluminis TaxID=467091 RepID=A0A4R7HVH9_9ACTN|nr:TetR/AcrR family transcriptional regulator [Ilumatobacter fluminis]TDT14997.1 TetR family transcriptional regulator [Ilumatobacter fluminis]